jgi:hypothetical protein
MLGALFKGLGSVLEKGLGAAGDAGHFIRYATGLTGQELKAAGRASSRKVGRILGREEQTANRIINRSADYQERIMRKEGMSFARSPRLAENTARYERAYASRQRAINFGLNRLLPAAGFYAAGQVGGAFIENRAEMQRSYMGEQAYTSQYGTAAGTAASIVRGAGTFLGIESLLGINPVQGAIAGAKQFKKFRRASAVYGRARRREATYARISRPVSPTATAPIRPTATSRASRRAEATARSGRTPRTRAERRQQQLNARKEAQLRGSQQEYLSRGSVVPRSAQRKYAQGRLTRAQKRLEKTGAFIGGVHTIPLGTAIIAGAAGASVLGAADSPFGLGMAIASVGLGLTLSPAGKAIGKFVTKYPVESIAGAGALTAGAAIGLSRQHYAAAEGNIEDVSYARESATSKLNYSTAGIVQSIHNNRRRM